MQFFLIVFINNKVKKGENIFKTKTHGASILGESMPVNARGHIEGVNTLPINFALSAFFFNQ